jgi:hypothetical protein
MREEDLEEYIGFCEEILPGKVDAGDGDAIAERYFRVMGSRGTKETKNHKEMGLGGGTEVRESGMRAGESYKIWHGRDIDGTLGSDWEKVVVRGARVAGVASEYLGAVVEQLERRLK